MSNINETMETLCDAFEEFKTRYDEKQDALTQAVSDIQKKANRPNIDGSGGETSSPEKKNFLHWVKTGDDSKIDRKSMTAGTSSEGGYLVPEQLDRELQKYLRARSPMRQLARVVNVTSAELKLPFSTLGTAASWVGETASRPNTTAPTIAMQTIPSCEIYANPAVTQQLLDDNAFDLENWLIQELADAFGDAEGAAFATGNGVACPRGLFTYDVVTTTDATRAYDKWQYVPSGGAGAFASTSPADALITLMHAVKPQYRANASWLMSPDALEAVRKFKTATTLEYIWQPSNQAGQPSTLFGYPVFEDENAPAIASNSLSVAFGDFSRAYTVTDRKAAVLRDPFTNKPFVNFYCTKRVGGGGGRDTRAVKFLKMATT